MFERFVERGTRYMRLSGCFEGAVRIGLKTLVVRRGVKEVVFFVYVGVCVSSFFLGF